MGMRPTQTKLDGKAKEALYKGVNAIFEPTKRTFGPQGKNALIYRTLNRGSRVTNDGVTVAGIIEPKDPFVKLAANFFKESCEKTNTKVGDGTTLTVIIGGVLFNEIYKIQSENENQLGVDAVGAQTLRNNIISSAEKIVADIKKGAKKIKTLKDLERIAIVSVQDEKLGKIIADMAWKVGVDGYIDVKEGYKGKIETEVIEGMKFPAKVAGNGFVNNPKKFEMVAEDCPVLITNYTCDNMGQMSKLLNPFLKENSKLIVIAPSFSGKVLEMMFKAMFKTTSNGIVQTGTSLYPTAVPSLRTDQFEDLATYCGARFIDKETGTKLQNARLEDLGMLEKLIVKQNEIREEATVIGGKGTRPNSVKIVHGTEEKFEDVEAVTPVEERIELLKGQIKEEKQEMNKKLLERRIASMSSAVGLIKVGSSTNADIFYNKHKIEDAVFACRSALRNGYIKGGGLGLKEIAEKLPDSDIIKTALIAPWEQIQSSVDGGIEITDDIIDPAEAVFYAVEHATEVIAQLSTCEILTIETEETQMGEGLIAIAKQILEHNAMWKIEKGQIQANDEEAYKDMFGGLTEDEYIDKQEQQN